MLNVIYISLEASDSFVALLLMKSGLKSLLPDAVHHNHRIWMSYIVAKHKIEAISISIKHTSSYT